MALCIATSSSLKVDHHGLGNIGAWTRIGRVPDFVVAPPAIAWERKRSGRQSTNNYPPDVNLRQIGWSFTAD